MAIWEKIDEVTTPSWDLVTILNSITYSESSGDTPSTGRAWYV